MGKLPTPKVKAQRPLALEVRTLHFFRFIKYYKSSNVNETGREFKS